MANLYIDILTQLVKSIRCDSNRIKVWFQTLLKVLRLILMLHIIFLSYNIDVGTKR